MTIPVSSAPEPGLSIYFDKTTFASMRREYLKAVKSINVSEQTYYRWKAKYGQLKLPG